MHKKTAKQLHTAFCEGALSAQEITHTFLKRIEAFDGQIGAFLKVFSERALAHAEALDVKRREGKPLGKLAGIPIALKDNIHVAGELTTCASKFLTNYRAPFDATVTELIEAEDGIILGKCNLDEFAMGSSTEHSALKKTNNPWDLSRVPGGSSGGSVAAVAAAFCPLALGSDTGGSVRQPAAFCGCVGFKPTYGRVSRYGLVAFGSSLDQIGPIGRSVEDISLIMEVIGRHDPRDATSANRPPMRREETPLKGKRIGVPWHLLEPLEAAPRQAFEQALEVYKKLGCTLVNIDLELFNASIATYYVLATAEAATNLARFDGIRYGVRAPAKTLEEAYLRSRSEGFGAEVKLRIMLGTYVLSSGYQEAYYKQATRVRMKMMELCDRVFESCDSIATPVTPTEAFEKGAIQDPLQMYLQDIFTIPANLVKIPAIAFPISPVNSLPFGLQLMGRRHEDALLCSMATAYEKATAPFPIAPPFSMEVS